MRHVFALQEASQESERRASMLAVVAGAARAMSTLDPEEVLEVVADSVQALGFEVTSISLLDEDTGTYRVSHGRGLPEGFAAAPHPIEKGLPGLVRAAGGTVVLEDYPRRPDALLPLVEAGIQSVVGSPIRQGGRLVAVLSAGTAEVRALTPQDVKAMELLAAQAAVALDNARRFEDERRTVIRLADLDRLKSEFLSTVSHELRTPLTVIEGMGLTLQAQWDVLDEATRRDLLDRLNSNAQSLERIIVTLLDFSSIESGRVQLRVRTVDLSSLLGSVVTRLAPLLARHAFRAEVEEGLVVGADEVLIERAVENLLTNAGRHTPAGTPVVLTARTEGDVVVVEVRDEGPGISRKDQARLGERFFRGGTVNDRSAKGLGLGLALVREILMLHGRTLEIESEVGRGAAFGFRLPLRAEAVTAAARLERVSL
jgi:K+-sensing histidine kinase KdpD